MSDTSKRTELTTSTGDKPTRTDLVPEPNRPIAPLPRGGNLLDHAFNSLPPEKQQELMATALEKKIAIEERAADANQSHTNFEREANQSVKHVRELGKTGMDVTATYEGRTASGAWNVEVRKSNYTIIIVIAAIIGIVALIVALR